MRFGAALALTVLATTGCAHLGPPCPGDSKWTELDSMHFIVDTDLPLNSATIFLDELEKSYAVFDNVAFEMRLQLKGKLRVVHFATESEYHDFGAIWSAGEFISAPPGDPEDVPSLVSAGEATPETRAVFRHELAHRFVSFHYQNAPSWLNEGLAEFYSTAFNSGNDVYLGGRPLQRSVDSRIRSVICERKEIVTWACFVPTGEVPALATLDAMSPTTFYGGGISSSSDSHERTIHYASAWAWVHFLKTGPSEYQTKFADYLAALARGDSAEHAFETNLAGLDANVMQKELIPHFGSNNLKMLKTEMQLTDRGTTHARTLTAPEVHVLFAKLAWSPQDEGRELARAQIDEALRHRPDHVDAQVMRAWLSLLDRNAKRAREQIDAVLAAHPDHPAALLARLRIDLAGDDSKFTSTPELEEIVKRLRKTASSSHALNELAWFYALTKRPDVGLSFSRRSLEAEPSCGSCWDTYANLLAQKSMFSDAATAETRAANFTWPSPMRDRFEKRAKEYAMRALKESAKVTPTTTSTTTP